MMNVVASLVHLRTQALARIVKQALDLARGMEDHESALALAMLLESMEWRSSTKPASLACPVVTRPARLAAVS